MITDLFYHKKSFTAFAILPRCEDWDTLKLEIDLLQNYLDISPIVCFEHRHLGEGEYWGHSVLKFGLHPSVVIDKHEVIELTQENKELLTPEPLKPLSKYI